MKFVLNMLLGDGEIFEASVIRVKQLIKVSEIMTSTTVVLISTDVPLRSTAPLLLYPTIS